jgi:hypothetical protein
MWLMTTESFFSATAIPGNARAGVQVRARVRGDLENLLSHFDTAEQRRFGKETSLAIRHTPDRDYEFRVFMTHEQWARYLAETALNLDYNNFQDAVSERQGSERHRVYLRVWSVLERALHDIEHAHPRQ